MQRTRGTESPSLDGARPQPGEPRIPGQRQPYEPESPDTGATETAEPSERSSRVRGRGVAALARLNRAKFLILLEVGIGVAASLAGAMLDSRPVVLAAALWAIVQLVALRGDLAVGWQLLRRTLSRAMACGLIASVYAALVLDRAHPFLAAILGMVTASMLGRVVLTHIRRGRMERQLRISRRGEATQSGEVAMRVQDLDAEEASRIVERALKAKVGSVVVEPGLVSTATMRQLSWALDEVGISLIIGLELPGTPSRRLAIEPGGDGVRVLPGAWRSGSRGVRELLDRLVALGLLVLLSPLLLAVAIAVRLDSRGSPIFVQTRVGKDGETFPMWKFRSMHTDAEARVQELDQRRDGGNSVLFKIQRDPRVTRVGRVIRATSIDELPQLVNVMRGQMSLIGPRPALPREVELYDDVARRRLVVRPGITGLWQVSGRSNLSWDESVDLDVDYVDNWSASRDLWIALRTVKAVVSRDGAY